MSTRARHGPFREEDGLNKPLFRRPAPDLRRMVWRDLRPILLRSAGVVGLAGVIVAVIASAPLADRPDAATAENVLLASSQGVSERSEAPVETPAAAAQRLAAFSSGTSDADAPPELLQAALTVQQRAARAQISAQTVPAVTATAPADAITWNAPVTASASGAGQTAPSEPTAAARNAVRMALAPSVPSLPEGQAEPASLWAEGATSCPRDWLASGNPEPTSADCAGGAPAAPVAATDPGQPVAAPGTPASLAEVPAPPEEFRSAALTLSPEALPSDSVTDASVPPIPRVRPEPPPDAVKKPARTKTAARGKLGPPPNCGKKYARWRYVNKQPTWYCK